jgi:hypothetical protein
MGNWLMVFFVSLLLGAAFAGSSYFVTKEQDIVFKCQIDTTASPSQQYNTYKQTDNGFPFAFSTKYSPLKKMAAKSRTRRVSARFMMRRIIFLRLQKLPK